MVQKNEQHSATDSLNAEAFGLRKAAYSVKEIVELTSIGRTSIYAAIRRGDLKTVKIGNRTLVLAPDLVQFLQQLTPGMDEKSSQRGTAARLARVDARPPAIDRGRAVSRSVRPPK